MAESLKDGPQVAPTLAASARDWQFVTETWPEHYPRLRLDLFKYLFRVGDI